MTRRTLTIDDVILWVATFIVLLICGAGSYEHVVVIPAWTENPPASLSVLHGPYAIQTARWWASVHGPALLMVAAAFALLRKQPRGRLVGIALGGYVFVLFLTFVWLLPELLAITTDLNAPIPPEEWKLRADRWEVLSIGRLVMVFFLGGSLLRAVAEPPPSVALATAPH